MAQSYRAKFRGHIALMFGCFLTFPASSAAMPLPSDLPSYAQIMPGGDVKSVTRDDKGVYITFTTHAPSAQIVAFYKQAAERSGMTSLGDNSDDTMPLQFANKSAFVIILLDKAAGNCTVRLGYHEDDPHGKSK